MPSSMKPFARIALAANRSQIGRPVLSLLFFLRHPHFVFDRLFKGLGELRLDRAEQLPAEEDFAI